MMRGVRLIVLLLAAWAASPGPVQAQFYPAGYGGFGWGGWGGGGGQTYTGDVARGLGQMAAGVGVYNQQTAIATSINAQTAMQFNQYMFQSQMEANQRQHQALAARQRLSNETAATIYDRLRNHPDQSDINSGNALNVVYDELSNPQVYAKVLKGAKVTVPGTLVRDIPFQYASEAITTSVDDLTQKGAPASLRTNDFEPERSEMRAIVQELRTQNQEKGTYERATLEQAQAKILALLKKVDKVYKRNSREWTDSTMFLKAAYGLSRMMETPAIELLLAGVEKRPEATLGELLNFMPSFNLRFGSAKTARQREVYQTLYPKLVALRAMRRWRGPRTPRRRPNRWGRSMPRPSSKVWTFRTSPRKCLRRRRRPTT